MAADRAQSWAAIVKYSYLMATKNIFRLENNLVMK